MLKIFWFVLGVAISIYFIDFGLFGEGIQRDYFEIFVPMFQKASFAFAAIAGAMHFGFGFE